jgi:hypothetical protein
MPTRIESKSAKAQTAPKTDAPSKKTKSSATSAAPKTETSWVSAKAKQAFQSAKKVAGQALADSGLLRTQMDNISGPQGMKVGKSFDTAQQSKAFFDQRLQKAEKFLKERGIEGQVVAKMVTCDMITVGGHAAVEHAEWQFFLVPKNDAAKTKTDANGVAFVGDKNQPKLTGLMDENAMTNWVKKETGQTGLLRSQDNPLFLGRLNLGEGGMGIYKAVPEYAEVGGQKYDTRHLESMVLVSPDKVRSSIDTVYKKLPGEWGEHGTCQQGVVATAESFGMDKGKVSKFINGLWLTRLKFGRTGNAKEV